MKARKILSKSLCLAALAAILALCVSHAVTRAAPPMIFIVTNTTDAGLGSLRQAILDSNGNPDMDTIAFNIPAPGVQTITPLSPLPTITDPVIIDGYTQPGSNPNTLPSGDDAVLLIEIDGSSTDWGTGVLTISAGKSTVRGLVINRCNGSGIRLVSNGANLIEGNFIGTDPTGYSYFDNPQIGVFIDSSSNNRIGRAEAKARNLISGNYYGVAFSGSASGNRVEGNFIGTDSSGRGELGNYYGVIVSNVLGNTIGGIEAAARNVISANFYHGVFIAGPRATGNNVWGNFIGTKADGSGMLGNGWHGVSIDFMASNNQIGGSSSTGNRIANNGFHGVSVASGAGNAILSNSIYSNSWMGIDLGNDGVTPNDPCDPDSGANNLQNTPQLRLLSSGGGGSTIEVKLQSAAGVSYKIEFFESAACDPTDYGEGQTLIGSGTVPVGGSCVTIFNVYFGPGVIPPGHFVTATMTDPVGNTSEFSKCVMTP
jgi:hypothetical protein